MTAPRSSDADRSVDEAGPERARTRRTSGSHHPGPPPAAPLVASVVAFLVAILIGPISGAGALPGPTAATGTIVAYYRAHAAVTGTSAWLLLLSAVLLAFYVAVLYSRLLFLAPNAPGPVIAGVGGLLAASLLAVSAVTNWVLSRPAIADQPALTRALTLVQFAAGGPAHVGALALLVVGVAVTTLFLNRTPRLLSILGLVLAAVDLVTTIALLVDALGPLVLFGRDASLLWLIAVSILLPRNRAARRPDRRAA